MNLNWPARATRGTSLRGWTIGIVGGVATFAAAQSYSHIHDLAKTHAQTGWVGTIDPLSVDGIILAATLVLMQMHHAKLEHRLLAHVMFWSGIGATVAANILYGLGYTTHGGEYGILSAVISAWPAYAFIGGIHMVVGLVRHGGPTPGKDDAPDPFEAARRDYRTSVAAGKPLSQRDIAGKHGISRRQAKRVAAETAVESNGHTVDA